MLSLIGFKVTSFKKRYFLVSLMLLFLSHVISITRFFYNNKPNQEVLHEICPCRYNLLSALIYPHFRSSLLWNAILYLACTCLFSYISIHSEGRRALHLLIADWQTDVPSGLFCWLTDRPTDRPTDWWANCLTDRELQTDVDCLQWGTDRLTNSLSHWQIDGLIDSLTGNIYRSFLLVQSR